MNRSTFIGLGVIALISSRLFAASPEEEQRITNVTKKAFEMNDANRVLDLFYWNGVPEDIKKMVSDSTKLAMEGPRAHTQKPNVSVSIIPPPAEFAKSEFVREGITYHPNLPITAALHVVCNLGEHSKTETNFPLGEKDGKLLIPQMAPVK